MLLEIFPYNKQVRSYKISWQELKKKKSNVQHVIFFNISLLSNKFLINLFNNVNLFSI